MATSSITYLGMKYYNGEWSRGGFITTQDTGYVGVKSTPSIIYSLCFKIQIPSFTGTSESIVFEFPYSMDGTGWDSTAYLHAAVTTFDGTEDNDIYGNTYGGLEDPNALLINYDITVPNVDNQFHDMWITLPVKGLVPGGIYYIYLYGSGDDTSLNACKLYNFHTGLYDATFSLSYQSGLVHVYNGSGWDNYQAYVYDGSNWNPYIPYVYDGNWKNLA